MPLKNDSPGFALPIRTATPSSVRAVNRSIMLELIRCRQPLPRRSGPVHRHIPQQLGSV